MLTLTDNEIHLWIIDCRRDLASLRQERALLSQEEIRLMQSFRHTRDQSRFAARHAGLRSILSRYLDLAADQVAYSRGAQGKLYLPAPSPPHNLSFNLSHSAELALVAVCRNREIGVDIEKVDPGFDVEAFAHYVCSDTEKAALQRIPSDQVRAFFRIWTRKEALLKAVGTGLVDDLRTVHALDDEVAVESQSAVATWRIQTLELAPGYIASVSFAAGAEQPAMRVHVWALQAAGAVAATQVHRNARTS